MTLNSRRGQNIYNTVGEVEGKLLVNKMTKRIKVIRVKTLGQELTVV